MSMFPGNARKEQVGLSIADRIDASVASQESKVYASKRLANFFEIEVTLKIFGNVVRVWNFPPKN